MTPLRNEKTEAGKEMWRKVDQAASRAPQWVQNHISALVAQHTTTVPETEESHTDMVAKQSK